MESSSEITPLNFRKVTQDFLKREVDFYSCIWVASQNRGLRGRLKTITHKLTKLQSIFVSEPDK